MEHMPREKETQAIQRTVRGLGEAWNANDMDAYASYLTETATGSTSWGCTGAGKQP